MEIPGIPDLLVPSSRLHTVLLRVIPMSGGVGGSHSIKRIVFEAPSVWGRKSGDVASAIVVDGFAVDGV